MKFAPSVNFSDVNICRVIKVSNPSVFHSVTRYDCGAIQTVHDVINLLPFINFKYRA
jgi:hypothetical protein